MVAVGEVPWLIGEPIAVRVCWQLSGYLEAASHHDGRSGVIDEERR